MRISISRYAVTPLRIPAGMTARSTDETKDFTFFSESSEDATQRLSARADSFTLLSISVCCRMRQM